MKKMKMMLIKIEFLLKIHLKISERLKRRIKTEFKKL